MVAVVIDVGVWGNASQPVVVIFVKVVVVTAFALVCCGCRSNASSRAAVRRWKGNPAQPCSVCLQRRRLWERDHLRHLGLSQRAGTLRPYLPVTLSFIKLTKKTQAVRHSVEKKINPCFSLTERERERERVCWAPYSLQCCVSSCGVGLAGHWGYLGTFVILIWVSGWTAVEDKIKASTRTVLCACDDQSWTFSKRLYYPFVTMCKCMTSKGMYDCQGNESYLEPWSSQLFLCLVCFCCVVILWYPH